MERPEPSIGLPRRPRSTCFVALLVLIAPTLLSTAASPAGQHLGDIVMDRASTANEIPAVVFPHWKHRTRFRCYACHPDSFAMKSGANAISMDDLRAGRYCGRCHDGRTAFPVAFETCRTCHSLATP